MCKPTTRLDEPLVGRASFHHLNPQALWRRGEEVAEQVDPVVNSTLAEPVCPVSQRAAYGRRLASKRVTGERLRDGPLTAVNCAEPLAVEGAETLIALQEGALLGSGCNSGESHARSPAEC